MTETWRERFDKDFGQFLTTSGGWRKCIEDFIQQELNRVHDESIKIAGVACPDLNDITHCQRCHEHIAEVLRTQRDDWKK